LNEHISFVQSKQSNAVGFDSRVIFLLFGGSKLPQLAKALGQSKKAFKEGLSEGEAEEQEKRRSDRPAIHQPRSQRLMMKLCLKKRARRARLRVAEGDIPAERK